MTTRVLKAFFPFLSPTFFLSLVLRNKQRLVQKLLVSTLAKL
jgi:hypothetical protein